MNNEHDRKMLRGCKPGDTVTLSDGRTVWKVKELRFNSCAGCAFAHEVGCHGCDGGYIFKQT